MRLIRALTAILCVAVAMASFAGKPAHSQAMAGRDLGAYRIHVAYYRTPRAARTNGWRSSRRDTHKPIMDLEIKEGLVISDTVYAPRYHEGEIPGTSSSSPSCHRRDGGRNSTSRARRRWENLSRHKGLRSGRACALGLDPGVQRKRPGEDRHDARSSVRVFPARFSREEVMRAGLTVGRCRPQHDTAHRASVDCTGPSVLTENAAVWREGAE